MYDEKYYQQYSRLSARAREFRVNFTLNLAEVSKKKPLKVLDLGCGDGIYSEALMKLGHTVVSMDISKEALCLSKERGIMNLIQGSASHLPYKPCTFDRVLFIDVFEHLKKPTKALLEIRKTLRLGGLLILSTLYPSILGRHIYSQDPTHQKLYTVDEVLGLLHSTDFKNTYTTVTSFLPGLYPFNIFLTRLVKTIIMARARKQEG